MFYYLIALALSLVYPSEMTKKTFEAIGAQTGVKAQLNEKSRKILKDIRSELRVIPGSSALLGAAYEIGIRQQIRIGANFGPIADRIEISANRNNGNISFIWRW